MQRSNPRLVPGDRFEGRYEIVAPLGEGGFGVVYKARQATTGQPVAVKIMRLVEQNGSVRPEKRVARFLREAQLCAQIHHPNTVQLIDAGQTSEGGLYTVFAFAPGETLAELLAREGTLSPREAQHLMLQVLDALACAHAAGVVHRDLKPSNIMVMPSGARRNALVLDFGISVIADPDQSEVRTRLTASDETVGTPGYAAPEQLRGYDPSPRADLFSWGLVFLECLTGVPVYRGRSAAEILYQQLSPEPVPLPYALQGHPLGKILRDATRKGEAEREVTAVELLRALEDCDLRGVSCDALLRGDGAARATTGQSTMMETAWGSSRAEGELRQVTAVCCTLAARAERGAPVDREVLDERIRASILAVAEIARRHRGLVVTALGEKLLLYFGYPRAAEDDALRAARAALAIQEEIARAEPVGGVGVEVKIGVHAGILVAGGLREAAGGGLGMGATAALAERLAERASLDGPLVSADARRLLRTGFSLEAGGALSFEGLAEHIEVFRLAQERSDVISALTPEGAKAPLIGRGTELDLLLERWRRVRTGSGQCSLITGEPGIGKSRLVRELRERLLGESLTFLDARCSPDAQNSALFPFVELLGRALQIDLETSPPARAARLEAQLVRHGLTPNEAMPLFAPLLGVPLVEPHGPLNVAPQRHKEMTHNAILSLLAAMAEERPVVLSIEDLHWADPTTLELLTQLIHEAPSGRYCVLLTARPEFSPSFPTTGMLQLHLNRLDQPQIESMVQGLLGDKPLPEVVLKQVLGRTDGVPLFVEELTRMMVDSGALVEQAERYELSRPLSQVEVPGTLRALLTARLDLLGRAKETAQLAAALGREFGIELLGAVSHAGAATVQEDLDALMRAGIIARKRRLKEPVCAFRHALVRDAAHESLPREARKKVHAHIARTLEAQFAEIVEARPDLLSHHHAAAEQKREAIAYAQRATQAALQRSAYVEAIRVGEEALGWLSAIEEEPERSETELSLSGVMTFALLAHGGVGASGLARVAQRTLELVDRLGDAADAAPTLWRLLLYYLHNRPETARTVAERLLTRVERSGNVGEEVALLPLLAQCHWLEGCFEEARIHLERALSIYDPVAHRKSADTYGIDSKVCAHVIFALLSWFMGQPDGALEHARTAVAWAKELDHPICIGNALLFLGGIHQYRGEREAACEAALEGKALSERYGLHSVGVFCGLLLCWATGDVEQGRQCLSSLRASGEQLSMTYWGALVAEAEAARDNLDGALECIEECRKRAEQSGEVFYLSEIYRLKATYLRAKGSEFEAVAEGLLWRALAIARRQGARMPALRASLDLARILQRRGALDEAEDVVRPAAEGFTEGLDAPEMLEARRWIAQMP
ncbi:TOMM system kinase/cyclase fusion protein [Chondromyces crocatus]|uniref:Protein kinase n=1 Tax=Chondromyces crocatus TaxID=52 RepID=A0A0K1ETI1_CHOCO|nr:TOMM system kinase/cyclase fusion protein [Chondromyces crocatus]AKT43943.1 protein kinase [Chondromyces crocatus]